MRRIKFLRYSLPYSDPVRPLTGARRGRPTTKASLTLVLQVEKEPEGDYSILGGCVEESQGKRMASVDFTPSEFSLVCRRIKAVEADVRMFIEEQMLKEEEVLL